MEHINVKPEEQSSQNIAFHIEESATLRFRAQINESRGRYLLISLIEEEIDLS